MGDSRRHSLFAGFIKKQFPKVKIILCIADGKGILSRKLANKGFKVFVIENKPRFEGRKHPNITYKKGWFCEKLKIDADLIIGMHPDEATLSIVRWAHKNKKPFAVVPCCIKGDPMDIFGIGKFEQWICKIKSITNQCLEYQLKMQGKNTIVFKR